MSPSLALGPRDLSSDVDGVRNTLSSWDACMSKAFCKWPVIVAIVVGSLIALSVVWCLARCLCCGAECCCGCLSCCNSCCPSPRRRERQGYQQPPQPPPGPQQFSPYSQYHNPQQPPVYGHGFGTAAPAGGYRGPQTATFDVSSGGNRNGRAQGAYNEDALPAMPSWDGATSKHVMAEEDDDDDVEDVEMEKLNHHAHYPQQQYENPAPTPQQNDGAGYYSDNYHRQLQQQQQQQQQQRYPPTNSNYHQQQQQQYPPTGDQTLAYAGTYHQQQQPQPPQQRNPAPSNQHPNTAYASPYHDSHDFISPQSPQSIYPPTYRTVGSPPPPSSSSPSTMFEPTSAHTYAPSTVPPSYRTAASPPPAPALASPSHPTAMMPSAPSYGVGNRRPVRGSWRDV